MEVTNQTKVYLHFSVLLHTEGPDHQVSSKAGQDLKRVVGEMEVTNQTKVYLHFSVLLHAEGPDHQVDHPGQLSQCHGGIRVLAS